MNVVTRIRTVLRSGSRFYKYSTMSPLLYDDGPKINRVAVIGAGPCGLAAAKYEIRVPAGSQGSGILANDNQVPPGGE